MQPDGLKSGEFIRSERVLNPVESTVRRGKNFLNSLVMAVIGLFLFFIVGPGLIFVSEFQYTSENFAKAVPAVASMPANGYVYLYGAPVLVSGNPCMVLTEKQCLYYSYVKEQYMKKSGVKCGTDAERSGVVKLSQSTDKCRKEVARSNGQDVEREVCEHCWNTEWYEWVPVDKKRSTPDFRLGVNTIKPSDKTSYKAFSNYATGDELVGQDKFREKLDYIEPSGNVLAVGAASNGVMGSGDPFVISTKDFESTKAQIQAEQASFSMMLKVIGFIALLIGMIMMLAPIAAFIEIFGGIPLLGSIFVGLGGITGGLIVVASLVVSVILTIVYTVLFKVLRLFVDNIVIVIVVALLFGLAVLVVAGLVISKLAKKKPA